MTSVSLEACGPARWAGLEAFFAMRAIPGLESVTDTGFRRNVPGGWVEVGSDANGDAVQVRYHLPAGADPTDLLSTVRRVADLDADLEPIRAHLETDEVLSVRLANHPLGRRPGAFDGFEVAVRAVVGQQISVAGARTLLGRLLAETAERSGSVHELHGEPHFDRFPTPELVAECPIEIGMPKRRRATIRAIATAVADGQVMLDPELETDVVAEQLLAVPGIGPWTAGYIAMRCLDDPDGWPVGDLALRRSLGIEAADLERRAERWRPWRAYAALLLWQTDPTTKK
ncbi:MAG: AlkA N-terminal domain-containing protein [Acidimicrobiales bacterium]